MSTRATYEFRDEHSTHTVYKHCDGYPSGARRWIRAALTKAWPLPRFEADEFGAAFIAANKGGTGDVRLTGSHASHCDTEYHYAVTCTNGALRVQVSTFGGAWGADRTLVPIFEGTLDEFDAYEEPVDSDPYRIEQGNF